MSKRDAYQLTKDEIDFIRRLRTGDIILNGRRVRKASDAIADDDYVTKRQIAGFSESSSGLLLPINLGDDTKVSGLLGPHHLPNSGVTAGTYGDATHVGQFTVDSLGRITTATDVAISGSGGGVTYRPSLGHFANTHTLSWSAITFGSNYSISFWFWLESAVNNYNPVISQDSNNEIYIGDGGASGKISIQRGGSVKLRTTTSITRYAWYFVVITDNGSVLKCYINNVDGGDSVASYSTLNGFAPIRLTQGVNANNFNGYIIEAAIWSKVLSAGEMTSLYNGGLGLRGDLSISPFTSGLVAGWHCSEGGSMIVDDFSGNGHTGSLNSYTQWHPFQSIASD